MGLGKWNGQDARQQLERVLSSPGFARNERLSGFLRFVVEQHLEGKDNELKESLIAIEVYGRKPDYDPKLDSIVRTEAGRLRARLAEYYAGEGSGDALVIELPKGGYTPVIRSDEKTPGAPRSGWGRVWPKMAVASLLAVLAAGTAWWWRELRSAPIAIAVLPLENLGRDPTNDYFADGLTDEIIRNLSLIEGLSVRSRTSSFAFRGKPRDLREAGKQLQAEYILEGSVLRAGQQLRINVQFVRVRDDFSLWSGRFDRELTDVFAIQDEISRGIVNSMRLKLGRGRRLYETSVEAYDLYLRARAQPIRGQSGYSPSVGPFEEVIAKDPSFAPAYAGLAATHAVRSGHFRYNLDDEVTKMRAAAEKAIQLDPLLAEAHDALGTAYSRDGQWERSEKSFRRAIELDPSRSASYDHFAVFLLLPLGRVGEALQQMRVAEKIDPLSSEVRFDVAYVLLSAGRYDEAAGYCEKLPADFRGKTSCLGRARLGQGRIDEVVRMLEPVVHRDAPSANDPNDNSRGFLGCAYARAGRREEAEQLAVASTVNLFNQVQIFACLGDKNRAFETLDRAAAAGPARMGRMLTWPELAVLRGDPRVKALRKKVGLPE